MAEAAEQWQVDGGTITRIRTVAKEGALGALASSHPGRPAAERDFELEAARADAARLGEALKEMAVKHPGPFRASVCRREFCSNVDTLALPKKITHSRPTASEAL